MGVIGAALELSGKLNFGFTRASSQCQHNSHAEAGCEQN
jgi:hypothetical protein